MSEPGHEPPGDDLDDDPGGEPGRAASSQQRPHQAFERVPERQRIVVAAAFLVVCLGFAWLLIPFSVEVDGSNVACGSPLTPAQLGADDPAYRACTDTAGGRQVVVAAVVVVAIAGAFVVRIWMNRRDRSDGAQAT